MEGVALANDDVVELASIVRELIDIVEADVLLGRTTTPENMPIVKQLEDLRARVVALEGG